MSDSSVMRRPLFSSEAAAGAYFEREAQAVEGPPVGRARSGAPASRMFGGVI